MRGENSSKTPREKAALPAATQKKPCCLKVIKKQRVALVQEKECNNQGNKKNTVERNKRKKETEKQAKI